MRYVVLFSGGESSAICAVEAVRRYGKENVILLNHNISPKTEHKDVKRFKREVADYCELEITYANMDGWEDKDQFDVCLELGGWKFGNSPILCTYNMKTKPFYNWLKQNVDHDKESFIFLYGFDKDEVARMTRRVTEMAKEGYVVDFPVARWDRTFGGIEDLGIKKPEQYKLFKHANCIGCLKAKRHHWYLIYCYYPEVYDKAVATEKAIGYSLIRDVWLEDIAENLFKPLKESGYVHNEWMNSHTFWAGAREVLSQELAGQCSLFDREDKKMTMPCDCGL